MPSKKARERYNTATYTRFSVFTDKDTANRIREAAEACGESLNQFIIAGAVARIEGTALPQVSIDKNAGAERLLVEQLQNKEDYQKAQEQLSTAYARLRNTSDRMAETIKAGLK